jgi:hypothetical protein
MLLGFNTNVRHRGVLFHVQTEDSGRRNPHVITHLYHHGTILASDKTDYADKLAGPDLDDTVKALMDTQHKAMLSRLRRGLYDAVIDERLGGVAAAVDDASDTTGSSTTQPDTPAPFSAEAGQTMPNAPARPFGQGIVTEKPLDEVVLEYLIDNARKRKRGSK